jgi:FlaA1/EpsC-like NDP-sugar epimerase
MEDHPAHAVSNNFFGTKSIVDAAVATGAERFVMISSDKAVNPTSVMGATKRLAEVYVRSIGLNSGAGGTRTSMVRFGNVLGSACSVLTIWATQIAEGGPVTITDPRMTRYFMTIPEAATLVIQSTTIGSGPSGSVYVLDMSKPIRILDLARRFVNAHGFEARVEGQSDVGGGPAIDIVFTGARPGEKIHEELAYSAELLRSTDHPGINSWGGDDGDAGRYASSSVVRMVADLSSVRSSQDREAVLASIRRHVPEMTQTNPK